MLDRRVEHIARHHVGELLAARLAAEPGGQGHDFADLAAGGRGAGAEVGMVGCVTGFIGPAAAVIAADGPVPGQALDPDPEGGAGGHIGKGLCWVSGTARAQAGLAKVADPATILAIWPRVTLALGR